MEELFAETTNLVLGEQLSSLSRKHFPNLAKLPHLEVVKGEKGHGPAWLVPLEGKLFIDERVAPFTQKTTKILILHELVHWSLYLEKGDPDDTEGERFLGELARLKREDAYKGLL
jgi:hypothetical protein